MLNDLRGRGVVDPKAFRHEGAIHQLTEKMLLYARLGQGHLQDWAHDVLHVILAAGCGCQRALSCFHDGMIERMPSFVGVDIFSVDHIRPL